MGISNSWERWSGRYRFLLQQAIEGEWTFRLGDLSLSPEMVGQLEAARRFLLREPERSRRVLRLLCANYLAHAETRGRQPRKPAVLGDVL